MRMRHLSSIIYREYSSRVKRRSFVIATLMVPVVAGGLAALGFWISNEQQQHVSVLVADPSNLCQSTIFVGKNEHPPATFYFTGFTEKTAFAEEEKYSNYDVLIALDPEVVTNKIIRGVYREEPSLNAQRYIAKKLELRLEEYAALDEEIPLDTYRRIQQPYSFHLSDIVDKEEQQLEKERQLVGSLFSLFIFSFIMIYAHQITTGILEEKTNRVVEILVSSVKPFELMLGKVIAVGLVGLTQFAVWIALLLLLLVALQGFFTVPIAPETLQAIAIGESSAEQWPAMVNNDMVELVYQKINWAVLIPLFVVYFLLGYLFYAGLFAIVGAAATSDADAQQLIMPILLPVLFVGFVFSNVIRHIDSTIALWGSYLPFSSPAIMLQRVSSRTVNSWEVVLSLILLLIACLFVIYGASKVYRTGILMYGKKASWRTILNWLRH